MLARTLLLLSPIFVAASLTACPSGRNAPDPNAAGSATATTQSSTGPVAAGPLSTLNPNDAKAESWQLESGPAPFLNWEALHLRISAGCRQPNGQVDCEAMRLLRGGQTVTLTPQERGRAIPAGALICKKTGNQLSTGRDPKGNEDGFCTFKDGSMASAGSLEFYVLKQ